MYNVCSVYRGWGGGEHSVHQRDTMSTLGDIMSTYWRMFSTLEGYHDARDIMIHVGGYNEYIGGCYIEVFNISQRLLSICSPT